MLFSQNGVPPPSPGATGGGDSLLSPPSVASLLDISLPGPPEEALAPGEPQTHISDSIIELAINSGHYGACLTNTSTNRVWFCVLMRGCAAFRTHCVCMCNLMAICMLHAGEEATLSPAKLSNNDGSKLLASSPSVSPSRGWIPSPSHDPQWYPSDSSDSTLGCLLCRLNEHTLADAFTDRLIEEEQKKSEL